MSRTWQGVAWRMLVGAIVVVTGGCAEDPAGPALAPTLDVDVVETASAPETDIFIANGRKYADAGRRPATGRAGSALAAMQALLAKDGSAVVEVVAGEEWTGWTRERTMHADPYGDARLAKVQLKAFDPSGEPEFTRNFTRLDASSASFPANGLLRGGRVEVQANIQDADPARTGVVTVEGPVLLRPDLAVLELRRPPRAVKNTAVPIVAVVRELNGDVGAWADCVLYVNGVETDRAYGMWVDAGGTVTCTMMHMFRQVGDARLEVRVENVAPGDYDPANNAATGTMSVILVRSDFWFDARFDDRTFSERRQYESSRTAPDGRAGSEWSSTWEADGRIQESYLSGFLPRAVAFPLGELFARQYTRDEVVHAVLFRQLPADWTYQGWYGRESCVSRGYHHPMTGRGWLYVCSYEIDDPAYGPGGFTTIYYDRYAGDVTYASREHSRYWNRDLGIDDVYSYNFTGRDVVGRFARYGLEYAFSIRLIDRGTIHTMNPFVGLLPFEMEQSVPRDCWSWTDPWGTSRSCWESAYRVTGMRGVVVGEPSR